MGTTQYTQTFLVNTNEDEITPRKPSYKSDFSAPPPVKTPYDPLESLDDIPGIHYALELFLSSKMKESEDYCKENDVKRERLYFATGYGLIQCVKGLMSYEDEDLLAGIEHTKHGSAIATKHRKKAGSIASRLVSSFGGSIDAIKNMTAVERHAELVYAESLLAKALLGILYSGDWLAFIKEAFNMRNTISIYGTLLKYIRVMDAESLANDGPSEHPSIDIHFRSGVYLGNGVVSLVLSLMPSRLQSVVEIFGYRGDRSEALYLLYRPGGWSTGSVEPTVSAVEEGARRVICDMILLIFHLVLSSFTFDGVDIPMAQKIVDWNLKRYPDGVFFLFGAGRLSLIRSQPQRAIHYYTRAMEVQNQYRNLHLISYWEIATATLCLWDLESSVEAWKVLQNEATWSKAIYAYGMAVCLLELADVQDAGETKPSSNTNKVPRLSSKEMRAQATELMKKVPGLRQKIAGKSIPLEKFVARKARKFLSQGGRLMLPGLELAYLFLAIAHAPRNSVTEGQMLVEVRRASAVVEKANEDPEKYEHGSGYWDDVCLIKLLEGICLRYIAYPDPDAESDPSEEPAMSVEEAVRGSEEAFNDVFKYGPKIELDHFLVYSAHYELGRLSACRGDIETAKKHFHLILSGKPLENSLTVRTHAAMEALNKNTRL
ncbi:hypothetical protein D9758_007656 [Tetrapyrgos nigripes]|uniref:Tetratricopeptide repeat protein 39B n=1 Tax=Tetrapyrgos nigripes TaxID=182062 RepID=A0A8H5G5G9_9AGAR|nr:hypothetical protein D9758_007656 [Tetrapyrgos nigripes]